MQFVLSKCVIIDNIKTHFTLVTLSSVSITSNLSDSVVVCDFVCKNQINIIKIFMELDHKNTFDDFLMKYKKYSV